MTEFVTLAANARRIHHSRMTTPPQGDLPKDPGILRTAAQHNQVNVGIYAAVQRVGTIRRGDLVRLAQPNNVL
jgi:hypothetical protein